MAEWSAGHRPVRRPALLVLASTYPRWPGDPEPAFVHELSRRMIDRFDVTVVCPRAPGSALRETVDGVKVIRYPYAPKRWETLVNDGGIVANLRRHRWKLLLLPGFFLSQAWIAWCVCRHARIDVVHAHWLIPQGLVAALLGLICGRRLPFVVTSHGADLYALKGPAWEAAKRIVAHRAAAVTVVSHTMLERPTLRDICTNKLSVQPMGVDLGGRFTPDPTVSRSERNLLFVGRLVEKKGVRHLLNAMPAVLRQLPDVELSLAGFGPEEAALQDQVARLGIEGSVRFLGAVSQTELPDLYRRAALFIAPFVEAGSGDQEGLGLVLVEAIGCACPVLAGKVDAVSDVLGHAYEEMTVDPTDDSALAARIVALLSDTRGARARVAQLREAIVERFEWGKVGEQYSLLLERVLPDLDRPR